MSTTTSTPTATKEALRTSPVVAFVEGCCIVGEFLVTMILFEMGSNNIVQALNYLSETLEEGKMIYNIVFYLSNFLSIFLSSILVLSWMTFRHFDILSNPEKPIPKYFGLFKFTTISSTLIFLPIFLGMIYKIIYFKILFI